MRPPIVQDLLGEPVVALLTIVCGILLAAYAYTAIREWWDYR